MSHRRIFITMAIFLVLGSFFLIRDKRDHASTQTDETPVRLHEIVVLPTNSDRAPSAVVSIPRPAKSQRASFNLDATEVFPDSQRPPLKALGHVWNWLSGVVAVPEVVANERGLSFRSSSHGFVLVSSGEVPEDVESFPILQRADNGIPGVFTGVIVTQSFHPLEGVDGLANNCGVRVSQSYPAIKSYLFKSLDKIETEESITCLRESGLFKRLEWEILVTPRLAQ